MNIGLSVEQQQAMDQSPEHLLQLTDPRTSTTYVLLPAEQYESMRELLEDERQQQAVRKVALRNAAARGGEAP